MSNLSLAIPAGILILTLAVPSSSQTSSETTAPADTARLIQTAVQASPATQTPAARQLSDDEMGSLLMIRKEYREAANLYKHLLEENPRSSLYLNRLGIAFHQQAELGLALRYYQQAVKVSPAYADAQNNIGVIWYDRKKYSKAVRAYNKAIAIRSDAPSFYMNLGYAYFADKKYEESIAAFRQALALDPGVFENSSQRAGTLVQDRSIHTDRGQFYFLLAKSFAQSGNVERCAHYLRKAKDEGYKDMDAVKRDPSFAAMLKDPAIQDVVALHVDAAQP
jgi:tetratricopeptide (TPR) repeat protein